jgi:uncharacterized protein YggE
MRNILILALSASAAFAQLEGFTASVSRSVVLAAEETNFQITATAKLDITEQQVVSALADFGVTPKDLVQVAVDSGYSFGNLVALAPTPRASYSFLITVPYARWREVAQKLSEAMRKPPENLVSLQFSASAQATAKSMEDARQRLLPEMLAEARRKAEVLAQAAGARLGRIEAINETYSPVSLPAAVTFISVVGVPTALTQPSTFNLFVRFRAEGGQ